METQEWGTLWQVADSMEEAKRWEAEWGAKGAKDFKLQYREKNNLVDVIFMVEKARAKEVIGFEPGEEEWLYTE